MRNSGIEWIGQVPNDWNLIKLGSIFQSRNEKVSDTDYPPLSVSKGGIVPQMDSVAKSDANDNRKLVLKNDFVINSRSDRKQSCGVSELDGSVSLINTVLYTIDEKLIYPKYMNYLLKNYGFAEEFYRWGHGIVADLWTTRWQEMKNIFLPIPSVSLQKKICFEVEQKLERIEQLINSQQEQIEKLKEYKQSVITEAVTKGLDKSAPMKDSGIEWIGDVPKNWITIKLKNIGQIRNGLIYSPDEMCDEEEGVLVLRSSNIKDGNLCFEDNVYVTTKIKDSLMVREKDVLICSRNGSRKLIGKNAIIPKNLIASFGAFMMIFRTSQNSKYVKRILDSSVFEYYLGTFLTATINQLTGENFNNMVVPFTEDVKEQEQIANYLDKKCAEIDGLILIKQEKIEKLNEYKKSLIYEYVTGKKEVV